MGPVDAFAEFIEGVGAILPYVFFGGLLIGVIREVGVKAFAAGVLFMLVIPGVIGVYVTGPILFGGHWAEPILGYCASFLIFLFGAGFVERWRAR
jgi:hypothetical protein